MMLEHLGEPAAAAAVMTAVEHVLDAPDSPLTPDLGGRSTTIEMGRAIAQAVLDAG